MSSTIVLPTCNGCNRPIMPKDKSVKFNCPECGFDLIWRCQRCREFAKKYTCPSCGFVGP